MPDGIGAAEWEIAVRGAMAAGLAKLAVAAFVLACAWVAGRAVLWGMRNEHDDVSGLAIMGGGALLFSFAFIAGTLLYEGTSCFVGPEWCALQLLDARGGP